ncbi:MAG: oxidoreductase, partial [Bacteroidetes bacterium]|nr:oxidoreductase [Bacteroidota bacterium]
TWSFVSIKDHSKFDFRDIEAFDSLNAVVMGSGSPAHFLRTNDGGKTWSMTYKNDRKEIFFDGMDFWDEKHGIAFSDPVHGKIYMVETVDGGQTWKPIADQFLPSVVDSEAGFAASGSSIRCLKGGVVMIGTGGKQAHLFIGTNYGKSWTRKNTPIAQGNNSSGIFSLSFSSNTNGIIIGGDYMADSLANNNCFTTSNSGVFWKKPKNPPFGYRSCVEQIDKKTYICTGTNGTDISTDNGLTWTSISKAGVTVVSTATKGQVVVLAGGKGKIGILVWK